MWRRGGEGDAWKLRVSDGRQLGDDEGMMHGNVEMMFDNRLTKVDLRQTA